MIIIDGDRIKIIEAIFYLFYNYVFFNKLLSYASTSKKKILKNKKKNKFYDINWILNTLNFTIVFNI